MATQRKAIEKELAIQLYSKMVLNRKYEERIYFLFLEGAVPGTVHQSQGQEACAAGVCTALSKEDYITSTHRPAGHSLCKGVSLQSMMCEVFAKSNGCAHAYGGAMHTGDMTVGAIPAIAIVGGGIPLAVGVGLSNKMQNNGKVVACFFGDGATNEGSFHESMNAAAVWKLPVIFVCENNLYGASTNYRQVSVKENVVDKAVGYGMESEIVDGNDVVAVYEATLRAKKRACAGKGPTLLELKTYRICGHSRNDACGYRSKDELTEWKKNDPIQRFRQYLTENGICDTAALDAIDEKTEQDLDEAVAFAKESPSPRPEDALKYVYFEGENGNG